MRTHSIEGDKDFIKWVKQLHTTIKTTPQYYEQNTPTDAYHRWSKAINLEQLTTTWLKDRGYSLGETMLVLEGKITLMMKNLRSKGKSYTHTCTHTYINKYNNIQDTCKRHRC